MPNHIHLVCTPFFTGDDPVPLSEILQSLKGYTARKANLLLGRQGVFWQHESYDHVVRDSEEFARVVKYVLENPRRAGLSDRWIYCRYPI
jgi:REP element-mobilizing transposase RayT